MSAEAGAEVTSTSVTAGAVAEMSLTLTSVPAVQEMLVLNQVLAAPPWMETASEKSRKVVPSTRKRGSAAGKTPVEWI